MSELPDGWRIECETDYSCPPDVDFFYVAYRWGTRTTKRLFRKPVTQTGWLRAGYASRWKDETVDWIHATVRAMGAAE